jgi:hypothetical protein
MAQTVPVTFRYSVARIGATSLLVRPHSTPTAQ